MPMPAFTILRQAIGFAKFDNRETRGLTLDLIDAIESADNENAGDSVENHKDVEESTEALAEHIIELMGDAIETNTDPTDAIVDADEIDEDDEIERD